MRFEVPRVRRELRPAQIGVWLWFRFRLYLGCFSRSHLERQFPQNCAPSGLFGRSLGGRLIREITRKVRLDSQVRCLGVFSGPGGVCGFRSLLLRLERLAKGFQLHRGNIEGGELRMPAFAFVDRRRKNRYLECGPPSLHVHIPDVRLISNLSGEKLRDQIIFLKRAEGLAID